MNFLDELQKDTNRSSLTENNALTNTSTLDPMLDFFSRAGAMRGREQEANQLFLKAYADNPQMALRCLFYLRDIRGGQGERSIFRYIISNMDEALADKVAQWIPEYGRWDEMPITGFTLNIIKKQLAEDEENMKAGKPISLLAKWMPSTNTSSGDTRKTALRLAKLLDLKESQYRKRVVALRKYYDNFLEHMMSEKLWAQIDYSKLPSQAHRKHVKAFKKHDGERYQTYLDSVQKGEAKINAGTLFTYEVFDLVKSGDDKAADAMWKNLPDYTNGQNALVLADVSGSMFGRPISISVSLALYFAERNEGPFKDYFMTFTSESKLQKVSGTTLTDKLRSIETSNWQMSTSIQSAFDAILKAAEASKAKPDEVPALLYIISDMEFDQATSANDETNFEAAQRKFKAAGYELPHLVFWNVNARGDHSPATKFDSRVTLISGSSQSTFQHVLAGKTPTDSMNDILNGDRYAQITI